LFALYFGASGTDVSLDDDASQGEHGSDAIIRAALSKELSHGCELRVVLEQSSLPAAGQPHLSAAVLLDENRAVDETEPVKRLRGALRAALRAGQQRGDVVEQRDSQELRAAADRDMQVLVRARAFLDARVVVLRTVDIEEVDVARVVVALPAQP